MKSISKNYLFITFLSSALSCSFLTSPSYGMSDVGEDLRRFGVFGTHSTATADQDMRFFWAEVLNPQEATLSQPEATQEELLSSQTISLSQPDEAPEAEEEAKKAHWGQQHMETHFWSHPSVSHLKTKCRDLDIRRIVQIAFENLKNPSNTRINHLDLALNQEEEKRIEARAVEIIDEMKTGLDLFINKFLKQEYVFVPELKTLLTRTSGEGGNLTQLGVGLPLSELENRAMVAMKAFYYGEYIPMFRSVGSYIIDCLGRTSLFPVRGEMEGYLNYCKPLVARGFNPGLLSKIIEIYTANENYFYLFANASLNGDYPQHMAEYIAALECAVNASPHKLRPDAFKDYALCPMEELVPEALMPNTVYYQGVGEKTIVTFLDPNDPAKIHKKTLDMSMEEGQEKILAELSRQNCLVYRGTLMSVIELFMMAHKKQFFLPSFVSTSTDINKAYYSEWNVDDWSAAQNTIEDFLRKVQNNEDVEWSGYKSQNITFEINIKHNEKTALVRSHSQYDEEECLLSPYNFYEYKGLKLLEVDNKYELGKKDIQVVAMLDLIDRAEADPEDKADYWVRLGTTEPETVKHKSSGSSNNKPLMTIFPDKLNNLRCKIDGKVESTPIRNKDTEAYGRVQKILQDPEAIKAYNRALKEVENKPAANGDGVPYANVVEQDRTAFMDDTRSSGYSRRQVPGNWFETRVSNTQRSRQESPNTLFSGLQDLAESYERNRHRKPFIFLEPKNYTETLRNMQAIKYLHSFYTNHKEINSISELVSMFKVELTSWNAQQKPVPSPCCPADFWQQIQKNLESTFPGK